MPLPAFAYRIYSGDKLLYHTSVCWGCENLILGPDGGRRSYAFKTDTEESQALLAASKKLFPDHPVSEWEPR